MRAELIAQTIHDGVLDMIHGMGRRAERLLVDGMVITVDKGKVHAFRGDVGADHEHLGWVDVPIEIVELARESVLASLALDSQMETLLEIMSKRS